MAEKPASVESPRGLHAKLAEVYLAVQRVPKTGKHPQGWSFATEGNIADMIRAELGKRGIVVIPTFVGHEEVGMGQTKSGTPITRHTVRLSFSVSDGTETITSAWYGQADDMSDKGLPKAITAARKTFLLSTFLVSTGDEPDAHDVQPAAPPPSKRQSRWAALTSMGLPEAEVLAILRSMGLESSAKLEDDKVYEDALQMVAVAVTELGKKGSNPGPTGDQAMGRGDG